MNSENNDKYTERVLLCGLDTGDSDEAERSIEELSRLAETAGAETVCTVIQKRSEPHPATYLGEGKIDEIRKFCDENNIDLIITDDEITGSQAKNLEDMTDVRVIDRTMLILDIFAKRAESSQGRLQVELAQLKYRLPRLAGFGKSLSRIGGGGKGGIATKGPGETKLETDKRHINRRIYALQTAIDEAGKRRDVAGQKRVKNKIPVCALVGYTNAGKSTLMNALCNSDVYVEDKLFATLDPTVRRMTFEDKKKEILLVDTVGFIRKLPHTLVESFKSTLDESMNADLLLHVVDSSDSEALRHIEIVESILSELNATDKPIFIVLNKSDKLKNVENVELSALRRKYENIFLVSAFSGNNIELLKKEIYKFFDKEREYSLLIPYTEGGVLSTVYSSSTVISSENREEGTYIKVNADFPPEFIEKIKKYEVIE